MRNFDQNGNRELEQCRNFTNKLKNQFIEGAFSLPFR